MKRLLAVLSVSIVSVCVCALGLTAPAHADGSGGVTITSTATSTGSAQVDSNVRAIVNGATQLVWEMPNHHIKVTKRSVRRAPHLMIRHCSQGTSSWIYRHAHHRSIVVIRAGSCLKNTGKYGHITAGFNWHLKHQAVLKFSRSIHKYRHVYNYYGGKLHKTCGNIIKKAAKTFRKVVQVRYALNVLKDISISASAQANAKAEGKLECSTGTLYGEASSSAQASASTHIRVKVREQVSASAAIKAKLLAEVKAEAEAQAKASASAKIHLECSPSQPPPAAQPPTVQIGQKNDVDVNDTATVCADYNVPGSDSGTLTFTSKFGSWPGGKSFAVSGQGQKCTTYQAPSEVPSGGKDTLTATVRDAQTGLSASDSTPITINSAPQPPL